MAGKPDDDVRLEAVGVPRHGLRDDTQRRVLRVIGLIGGLVQRGGEFAERAQPSVERELVDPDGAKPGQERALLVLAGPVLEPAARNQHAFASRVPT